MQSFEEVEHNQPSVLQCFGRSREYYTLLYYITLLMQCCPYEALAQTVEANQVKLLRDAQGSWLHERLHDATSAVNDYKPRVIDSVAS